MCILHRFDCYFLYLFQCGGQFNSPNEFSFLPPQFLLKKIAVKLTSIITQSSVIKQGREFLYIYILKIVTKQHITNNRTNPIENNIEIKQNLSFLGTVA